MDSDDDSMTGSLESHDDKMNSQLLDFKSVCVVEDDITFIRLASSKTTHELIDMFEFLKLRFRILNTKVFLNQCIRNILNRRDLDLKYYPHLLSWHFTDCPVVSKNDQTARISRTCDCKFGIKYPDYHFLDRDLFDGWCFEGDVLSLTRIANQECANQATRSLQNFVVRNRFFGYFDGDEYGYSVQMSRWRPLKLKLACYHVANRLRYTMYLMTLKKYGFSVGSDSELGIKVVDHNTFHLNQCQWTAKDHLNGAAAACDCNLAFDHPKGWLHLRYDAFEKDEVGYAMIERPVLD